MSHELLAQALKSSQSGESLPEDVQAWLLDGLIAYISNDCSVGDALGLNGVEKRTWWLNARNTALREAWTVIKETTDLSNRKAAHVLFEMLEGNTANLRNSTSRAESNYANLQNKTANMEVGGDTVSDHSANLRNGQTSQAEAAEMADDDLATLVADIRAASDHCGHLKSGESTYQIIWSLINGLM